MYKHSVLKNKIDAFVVNCQSLTPDVKDFSGVMKVASNSLSKISSHIKKILPDLFDMEIVGANQMLDSIAKFNKDINESELVSVIRGIYKGLSTLKLNRSDYSRYTSLLSPISAELDSLDFIMKSLNDKPKEDKVKYRIDQQAGYLVNMFSSLRSKLKIDETSPYESPESEKVRETNKEKLVVAYRKIIDSFINIFTKLPKELSLPDSYMSKEDLDVAKNYSLAKMKAEDFVNKSMLFTGVDMASDPKVLMLKDLLSKVPGSSGVRSIVSEISEYSKTLLNIKLGATNVDGLLQSLLEFITMSENKYGMRTADMKKRSTSLLSWIRQKSSDGSKESLNEILAAVNRFLNEFCNTEPKLKTEKEYYAVWRNIRSVQGQK